MNLQNSLRLSADQVFRIKLEEEDVDETRWIEKLKKEKNPEKINTEKEKKQQQPEQPNQKEN
jgi:hypothetical protein